MLARALLCVLLPASLLRAQDASTSSAPRRETGLDLRIGFSRPQDPVSATRDGRTLVAGGVPTFSFDGRIATRGIVSVHFSGEMMPFQPMRYSAARNCFELCSSFTSYATALQGGATVRASHGPIYVGYTLAERGTLASPTPICPSANCVSDFIFHTDGTLRSVNRFAIGIRPGGCCLRPTAEASLALSHPTVGTYRRDLEISTGIAF